jgi:hypothetical protein
LFVQRPAAKIKLIPAIIDKEAQMGLATGQQKTTIDDFALIKERKSSRWE